MRHVQLSCDLTPQHLGLIKVPIMHRGPLNINNLICMMYIQVCIELVGNKSPD